MKAHLHHRPSSRSLALALLTVALLVAATIAAAFTREADMEAARANSGLRPLVLVAGAPGVMGQLIAQRATSAGLAVRTTMPGERQWSTLDAHDALAVKEYAHGADLVVCGLLGRGPERPESLQFDDYRGFVNLVDAARAGGARHFVLVSAVWSGSPRNAKFASRADQVIAWKVKAEEYLKASGLSHTILRTGTLRDEPRGSTGPRIARRGGHRGTTVANGDVARIAIDALRNPAARNRTFALLSDAAVASYVSRVELHATPRDDGTRGARAVAAPGPERSLVPTPSRERLMIEDQGVESGMPSVDWTSASASS